MGTHLFGSPGTLQCYSILVVFKDFAAFLAFKIQIPLFLPPPKNLNDQNEAVFYFLIFILICDPNFGYTKKFAVKLTFNFFISSLYLSL